MTIRIPEEVRGEVIALRTSGMKVDDIAKKFRISNVSVRNIVRGHGLINEKKSKETKQAWIRRRPGHDSEKHGTGISTGY